MSMTVCRNKTTGNLIEAQSDPNSGPALLKNAISSGHDQSLLEVVIMSDAQWSLYRQTALPTEETYQQKRAVAYPLLWEIIEDLQAQNVFSPPMKARIAAVQASSPAVAFVPPVT